jgi:hypothetical protein
LKTRASRIAGGVGKGRVGALVLAAGMIAAGPMTADANAAPATPTTAEDREAAALFEQTLARPDDISLLLRYAAAATQAGDLEGAVSAYERIVMLDPTRPRARFELGVLYWAMGSPGAARAYLEDAAAHPDLPPRLRAEARRLLATAPGAAPAPAQTAPTAAAAPPATGRILTGLRYQTNPEAISSKVPTAADNDDQDDFNALAWAYGTHWAALGDGSVLWESDGELYGSWQFENHDATLHYGRLHTGPRFSPLADDPVSLRPYVILSGLLVKDDPFGAEIGGGLSALRTLGDRASVTFSVESAWVPQFDSAERPDNADRGGWETRAAAEAAYALTDVHSLTANAEYRYRDASRTAFDHHAVKLGLGWAAQYDSPFEALPHGWTTSLQGHWEWLSYAEADPGAPTEGRRVDSGWHVTASQMIGLAEDWDLHVQATYSRVDSEVDSYTWENIGTMIGVSWHF